jgi:predicted transcriptional regulator
MASERMTISLPTKTAKRMREMARKTGKPLSRVIADELAENESMKLRSKLAADYQAAAKEEETRRATEDISAIAGETFPDA